MFVFIFTLFNSFSRESFSKGMHYRPIPYACTGEGAVNIDRRPILIPTSNTPQPGKPLMAAGGGDPEECGDLSRLSINIPVIIRGEARIIEKRARNKKLGSYAGAGMAVAMGLRLPCSS